eukprot:31527-Pelagococcus_subviridis.AAC.7
MCVAVLPARRSIDRPSVRPRPSRIRENARANLSSPSSSLLHLSPSLLLESQGAIRRERRGDVVEADVPDRGDARARPRARRRRRGDTHRASRLLRARGGGDRDRDDDVGRGGNHQVPRGRRGRPPELAVAAHGDARREGVQVDRRRRRGDAHADSEADDE